MFGGSLGPVTLVVITMYVGQRRHYYSSNLLSYQEVYLIVFSITQQSDVISDRHRSTEHTRVTKIRPSKARK